MQLQWTQTKPALVNLDDECALWDWARTAGLSAAELREALAAFISEAWMWGGTEEAHLDEVGGRR
jgi:hypothetical protein